ncbi:hypothetical protein [Sphingomonas sp. So64.6b]|uniref:hypothetical protein n=1 Tax=Sphingomonas sp. So64.6b TaxID=2997354 RepID=UPI001FCF047E|nr:hypothetical protein [Sphingomonas sp. So64.6b]
MSDDSVPEMNEIEAAAREAKRAREAADASVEAREDGGNWPILPISIGVGSAALAAALLYANRSRKKRD